MATKPAPQPENTPVPTLGAARSSKLRIDQFMPRYDSAVVHAGVFRAPSEACYRAARGLDLLRGPVIRTLLGPR
jgi:hypothetical protein